MASGNARLNVARGGGQLRVERSQEERPLGRHLHLAGRKRFGLYTAALSK